MPFALGAAGRSVAAQHTSVAQWQECAPAARWGTAVASAVATAVRGWTAVAAPVAAAAKASARGTTVRVLDPQARAAELVAVARDDGVGGRPVQRRRRAEHSVLTASCM